MLAGSLRKVEEAAVEAVSSEEVVDFLRELIAIDSSESESLVARAVADKLASAGITATFHEIAPGRPNVVARLGTQGGRTLLFNAHMDTVPVGNADAWTFAPLGGVVRDGRVYGRGATDNKSGVAALVMAVVALARARTALAGELILACVAGELEGNVGTRRLGEGGLKADFAIVGEYSEGDKIAITYRGVIWGRAIVRGRTAHPGRAAMGADAVKASLDRVIPALRAFRFDFTPDPLLPDPQLTITQIACGRRPNTIADECVITFDVRLLPGQSYAAVWADIESVLIRAVEPSSGISVQAEMIYGVDPFATAWEDPFVRQLADCVAIFTGIAPAAMGKVGFCDANVLVNEFGIRSVAYGPGNSSGLAVDEYCEIDRLDLCRKVYSVAALRMLGVIEGETAPPDHSRLLSQTSSRQIGPS